MEFTRKRIPWIIFLFYPALLYGQKPPNAHYLQTVFTSSEYGQGSSAISSVDPISGIFHNPAVIGLGRGYAIDGGYIQDNNGFSVAFVDAENATFSGGVGYLQLKGRDNVTIRKVPVSVGKRIHSHVSLGSTMSWAQVNGNDEWLFDVGLWTMISQNLSMGIVGKNLLGTPDVFDGRTLQIGFRLQLPIPVVINTLVGRDFQRTKTMAFAVGSETTLPYDLKLLAGLRQTGYEGLFSYWSTGLGYIYQKVGIFVNYEQAVKSPKNPNFFISVNYQR